MANPNPTNGPRSTARNVTRNSTRNISTITIAGMLVPLSRLRIGPVHCSCENS